MEENQKHSKILEDCAAVSELLRNNNLIIDSQITLHITPSNYPHLLNEIEEFVRVRVERDRPQVSLKISDTEFIFIKK